MNGRNRQYGSPCPHHPDRYKYEAQHQSYLDSKRRCDEKRRSAKPRHEFESHGYPLRRRLQLLMSAINSRCRHHPRYAGRGIRNFLTFDNLEFLWQRDKAGEMQRPSIDRRDNDGHYSVENCRFIELFENISLGTRVREANRFNGSEAAP